MKERECVQVVFEGDKLIQVLLLFLLSITCCLHLLLLSCFSVILLLFTSSLLLFSFLTHVYLTLSLHG